MRTFDSADGWRRSSALLVLGSLLAVLLIVMQPPAPAHASGETPGICVGRADGAHPSTGAGGQYVIVKGRFTCGPNVNWAQFTTTLYHCQSKPASGSTAGCAAIAPPGQRTETPPVPGEEYTVHGPPKGSTGGVADGWYVGQSVWAWSGSAGYLVGTHTSSARYCKRTLLIMDCQDFKF